MHHSEMCFSLIQRKDGDLPTISARTQQRKPGRTDRTVKGGKERNSKLTAGIDGFSQAPDA